MDGHAMADDPNGERFGVTWQVCCAVLVFPPYCVTPVTGPCCSRMMMLIIALTVRPSSTLSNGQICCESGAAIHTTLQEAPLQILRFGRL